MNIENDAPAPSYGVTTRPPAPPPRTKNQIKAAALADAGAKKAKWKTLTAEARTTWPQVAREDLDQVEGNFSKLAGLVQLRYQIGRAESDQQVRAFFDKHYPAA